MKAAVLATALFLGLCVGTGAAQANTYQNCSTNYSVLEAAYLNTEENHFKTWATFYPPRDPLPLFVKVTYEFQDKNGETQNYNNTLTAHYIWTKESIFLMQPPQVFGFTSLFLGYAGRERIQQVTLVLPYECRGLTITIADDKYNRLEVLTQRLKLYAQRSNGVTLTDDYFAKAIDESSDGLVDKYRNNSILKTFVSVLIGLPFVFLVLILLYAKGARWQIRKRLVLGTPAAHASLAAVVVTGLLFAIFVVFMDAAALYYAINDNEFDNTKSEKHSFHNVPLLWITAVTFVLDSIFTLGAFYMLAVASCHHWLWSLSEDNKVFCNEVFKKCCFVMFGYSTVPGKNVEEKSIWLLLGTLVAPIGCIGTHLGYIIIAWLSLPIHAGAIFLAYILCFVCYFFTFRQLYLLIVDRVNPWHNWVCCNKTDETDETSDIELRQPPHDKEESKKSVKEREFQFFILVIELVIGLLLAGVQVWVTAGVVPLPINNLVENASIYLYTFATTILVTIAGLVTYKVLVIHPKQDPNASFYKKLLETTKYIKGKTTDNATTAEGTATTSDAEGTAPTRDPEDNAPVPTCYSDTERAGALLGVFIFRSEDGNERERIKKVHEKVLGDHATANQPRGAVNQLQANANMRAYQSLEADGDR